MFIFQNDFYRLFQSRRGHSESISCILIKKNQSRLQNLSCNWCVCRAQKPPHSHKHTEEMIWSSLVPMALCGNRSVQNNSRSIIWRYWSITWYNLLFLPLQYCVGSDERLRAQHGVWARPARSSALQTQTSRSRHNKSGSNCGRTTLVRTWARLLHQLQREYKVLPWK